MHQQSEGPDQFKHFEQTEIKAGETHYCCQQKHEQGKYTACRSTTNIKSACNSPNLQEFKIECTSHEDEGSDGGNETSEFSVT